MEKNIALNLQTLKNSKIGIIGGTFDPIHYGHLFIAQTALYKFNLDKILFIPTGKPPHKQKDLITNAHKRLHMVSLAIENNPKFELSIIEANRQKTSYTIDTIKELQQHYSKETEFYFITGSDAFIDIETWKNYKELLKMIKFIVMTRQTYENNILDDKIKLFTNECNAHIIKVEIPIWDISSTNIRKRVKEGAFIKYLLPESVEEYILHNKLYLS